MATVKTFLRTARCGLVVALVCGSAMVSAQPAVSTKSDAFVHPNLIVSVSWLMQHATDPHLRLVDARPTAEYDKGHIPGAVSLPVADTFDPAQPKNYPDTKEKLEALFARRGLSNTTRWSWPHDSGSSAGSVLRGQTHASRVYFRDIQNLSFRREVLVLYVDSSVALCPA